jgi:predicted dehydrogenase
MKVGLLGTGNIAPQYVKWSRPHDILDVIACADMDTARANAFASEHGLRALSIDALLHHPEIDIIINLTVPKVHAETNLAIIEAGKHVYSEKPLAITREDGQRILAAAAAKGVRVGCAPDTVLGGGIQTCRKMIDEGWIGEPIAATGFMAYQRGPDLWHPNPWIFFQKGAGPMLDMGPYYLTTLVTLMGGMKRVTAMGRASFPVRIAQNETIRGQEINVEVPTYMTGNIEFASGAIGSLTMTFDLWAHHQPWIEVYGSEGSLRVPDPNMFGGEVEVWRRGEDEWRSVPLMFSDQVGRGLGVADMAQAIREGREHRASGALAYHVLDAMLAFEEAAASGQSVVLASEVARPAGM